MQETYTGTFVKTYKLSLDIVIFLGGKDLLHNHHVVIVYLHSLHLYAITLRTLFDWMQPVTTATDENHYRVSEILSKSVMGGEKDSRSLFSIDDVVKKVFFEKNVFTKFDVYHFYNCASKFLLI